MAVLKATSLATCFSVVIVFATIHACEARVIKLECKGAGDKSNSVALILVDDVKKTVSVNVTTRTDDVEMHQILRYRDGATQRSLEHLSFKSFVGRQNEFDYIARENMKKPPQRQHVSINDGKIEYGEEGKIDTIDMDAGGISTHHNGNKGFCDYR